MKKLIIAILIVPVFMACTSKPVDVKSDVVKKLKELNSIHFKAVEKSYYSNEPDTTVTPYEVWAVRDAGDSLKGGYVWVDNNYRPYNMMYEKGDFYLAIPPKKTTILYPGFNEPFINETDWIDFFLKPDVFAEILSGKQNKVEIKDTLFNGKESILMKVDFPKSRKGKSKHYTFVLDRKMYAPQWSEFTMITKDFIYHDVMEFSGFEVNSVDLPALKERQKKVLAENPVEVNGAGGELSRLEKMLHPGDAAPLFMAKYYSNEKSFELKDFIGKNVIIVDFWYTHCHPCVKAMPSLDKLYRKYSDKGLKVFGLNSVDNQPRSRKMLDNFLSKRDISYDIILATPEVDIMYKVNGYPTMYVVDKNGKIAYSEIGFDEESFSKLVEKVEELLR